MNSPILIPILSILGALAIAVVFLLIGWKFGRESLHLTPFSYSADNGGQPQDVVVDEVDPWDEATKLRVIQ